MNSIADLKLFNISNGALKGKDLPSRLKIGAWGDNDYVGGSFRVTHNSVNKIAAQKNLGYERVAIDFNHCSVPGQDAYKDLLKAGQPPLIFGYGRPSVTPHEGAFLEEIIWTPLGQQHARNFEDISPAIHDTDGELDLVHSIALTPNGKITGLTFFSSSAIQTPKPMKSLSEIFNQENKANGQDTPHRFFSAAGGTNQKDATADPRLKILNECGRLGKCLHKPDGTQYSSNELFAMPLDELQALFNKTPADSSYAHEANNPNMANKPSKVGDGTRPIVSMAALFDRENALTLLSARAFRTTEFAEDVERAKIIRRLIAENKVILKDSFTPCTATDLANMRIDILRVCAENCQSVKVVI